MGSTRLPGKVLMDVGGRPVLAFMVQRLESSQTLSQVCVATSSLERDEPIVTLCEAMGTRCIRGPEEDVLERYRLAAEILGADVVVRLTADCPLICPKVMDQVVSAFLAADPPVDYASNCLRRTYPRGLDTEVFSRSALDLAAREATVPSDREHVTPFIWRQPRRFRHLNVEDTEDYSGLRWTVDTEEDLQFVRRMVGALGERASGATYQELRAHYLAHPEWACINAAVEQKGIAQ